MAEYLDVIDDNGNLIGEIVERNIAHAKGIRHRASHTWLVRKNCGKIQCLLQKRSLQKDSFPGCYDISSAGHVASGEDFETAAVREIQEELGIRIQKEELVFCGNRKISWKGAFNGRPFYDLQHSKVFLVWKNLEEEDFHVDKMEVESVLWINLDTCIENVEKNLFPNAIAMEELHILERALDI